MRNAVAACLALLVLAASPPAHAQRDGTDAWLIGMPMYTADGVQIGSVTEFATYKGENSLIGEVASPMGFGVRKVLVPSEMAIVAGDRIVLSITSDRVKELLSPDL